MFAPIDDPTVVNPGCAMLAELRVLEYAPGWGTCRCRACVAYAEALRDDSPREGPRSPA